MWCAITALSEATYSEPERAMIRIRRRSTRPTSTRLGLPVEYKMKRRKKSLSTCRVNVLELLVHEESGS